MSVTLKNPTCVDFCPSVVDFLKDADIIAQLLFRINLKIQEFAGNFLKFYRVCILCLHNCINLRLLSVQCRSFLSLPQIQPSITSSNIMVANPSTMPIVAV